MTQTVQHRSRQMKAIASILKCQAILTFRRIVGPSFAGSSTQRRQSVFSATDLQERGIMFFWNIFKPFDA